MGGYLPNAPVNEAAHQFMEKKCSEGKHDKGYMTIPFTTQSWFDPAPRSSWQLVTEIVSTGRKIGS